ncbi:MAG TPA: serine hydrolase [Alphaproteobacteria bacterium]|nr:serine hydrolase [Alphaproteobacteria bacterium]
MKKLLYALALGPTLTLAVPALAADATAADSPVPSDTEIQRMVDDRVATYQDTVGLVVGIVTPQSRKIFMRGTYDVGDDVPVDGDTIFDIGGVSKLFTALLLSDMVRKGEVGLRDPAQKYLAGDMKLPARGRPITLLDLATHRSGLPPEPSNVLITDPNNPNKSVSPEQLEKFLAGYELPREVGAEYEYSDLGYEVLALALAAREQKDFASLLSSRILEPMHLASTGFDPAGTAKDKVTIGHDAHLQPIRPKPLPALLGANSLKSSAKDLMELVAAAMGDPNAKLAPSATDMLKVRLATDVESRSAGIGWYIATVDGADIVWLNSEANGYRSFVGFAPAKHLGVVLLSNSVNPIDDLAIHLLDPQSPLRTLRRAVQVDPARFDQFVGMFAVNNNFLINITRDKGRLFIQPYGQSRAELFAESDDKFFLRDLDAEVTFQTDSAGYAQSLLLTQGKDIKIAKRIR